MSPVLASCLPSQRNDLSPSAMPRTGKFARIVCAVLIFTEPKRQRFLRENNRTGSVNWAIGPLT